MSAPPRAALRRTRTTLGLLLPVALAAAGVVALTTSTSPASPAYRTVSWKDGSPIGALTSASITPGGLRVTGWDLDPNAVTSSLLTAANVDGKPTGSHVIASIPDAAVAKAHSRAGARHGFTWRVPVPEGRHQVCIAARNTGRGHNSTLGCRTATFDYGPLGRVDHVTPGRGALRVSGWTFDRDAPTRSLPVTVSIDGAKHSLTADLNRPDVARVYPSAGAAHGYDATFAASQGMHTVCVTAANVGYGSANSLGCSKVTLDESPVAALDSVGRTAGKLHVRGWAYDPDAATTPLTVTVSVDGAKPSTVVADDTRTDVASAHPTAGANHGFDLALPAAEGVHRVCVTVVNVSYGSNRTLGCHNVNLDFTPSAAVTALSPGTTGVTARGWAVDPDTSTPITVRISVDGGTAQTITANRDSKSGSYRGRQFSQFLAVGSGTHKVCAVGVNVVYGTHNSPAACRTVTLALSPLGAYTALTRASNSDDVVVSGWAFDPDSSGAATVTATVDGKSAGSFLADATSTATTKDYPRFGDRHGIAHTIATTDGEHTVCLTVRNVGGGQDRSLGCKLIIAVHPSAPAAPRTVKAVGGFGGATVSWTAPASDGGAPISSYTVTASPGGRSVTVNASTLSTGVLGLKAKTAYVFTVVARNQAGNSIGGRSATVRTTAGPPAQRSPAPVSTSRYIRNAVNASSGELAKMRAEGVADAKDNPSGHGYMVLLDIGGQDQYDHGVVLSAGVRFVTYATLVKDVNAYVDGYHSAQRSSAPVTIALGTNNDINVNSTTGAIWADSLVDPVRSHASRYVNMSIAGADDIEPGFRASYSATKSWLQGYLKATSAPFVFNGSADGCSYTSTSSRCNNGWTMSGLQYLAGGAAPTRILNLPQIYNTAMAGQWKYISLTGIAHRLPRINFAGPLTELTACRQAGGCGSMSGHTAWNELWSRLQSDSRLKVSSLPYSTDLRIDR